MSKSLMNLDAYGIVQARGTMYPYPIIKKTNPTSSNIVQVGRMWINTATNAFFVYTSNGNWASLSNTTGVFTGGLTVTGSPTSITSAVLGLNDTGTGATTIGNATGVLAFVGSAVGVTGPLTSVGTILLNTTGTAATTIGNTTGKTGVVGDLTVTTGDIHVGTAGKTLVVKAGATAGTTVAMTAGAVTVNTAAVAATSTIILTHNTPGGTPGALYVSAITPGVSFAIASTSALDTSTVNWTIINQN